MPVEYIHFVIHHSINSFLQNIHTQIMPGSINKQPSISKQRLVLNMNRQSNHVTGITFYVTLNWLHKCFEASDKANIKICDNLCFFLTDMKLIRLLLSSECTSELIVRDFDFDFVLKIKLRFYFLLFFHSNNMSF